jgi:hypothetical protein
MQELAIIYRLKQLLALTIIVLCASCVSKTLVKNCTMTSEGNYFVCDQVYFK